jgi:molybdenum cofactor cytidylyltransferase
LQHVLDAAAASRLDEIVVVLGYEAPRIRAAIQLPAARAARVVVNPRHAEGQSTSLRTGLQATDPRATAAAILLGDQPLVTAALIDRLLAAFTAADAPVVRPVYRDAAGRRTPGHPVLIARRIWPLLEQLRGDHGAGPLLAAHPDWVMEVPVPGAPPADIDSPEDYQRAVDAVRSAVHTASAGTEPGRF